MTWSASTAPADFSWLSPAFRPSRSEVETYARLIAATYGEPPELMASHLREAELQLWIWRNETRQRPASRRRPAARR